MHRPPRNYYQIYRVDHKRNQEQMVAEVEGLRETEALVEKYLRNLTASEKKMKSAITGALFRAAYQRCSGYRGSANSLSSELKWSNALGRLRWVVTAYSTASLTCFLKSENEASLAGCHLDSAAPTTKLHPSAEP